MSTVNKISKISKDGVEYEISAVFDDLDNKISEKYATKEELAALQEAFEKRIAKLEANSSELDS
jgi:hypothetical protein